MDYLVKIRSVQTPLNGQFSIGANRHAMVTNTYWYLTGIPELMAVAAERFESFTQMPEVYHD